MPMPPLSKVGGRGTGTVLGPRMTGALGCVPCMLLGLARRIGLLYGLLAAPVGLWANSKGNAGDGPSARATLFSTALKAIAMMPGTNRFMGSLSTWIALSIARYAQGSDLLTKTSPARCNTKLIPPAGRGRTPLKLLRRAAGHLIITRE